MATGVIVVTILVKLKTVKHLVLVKIRQVRAAALNVKPGNGDHFVTVIARKIVRESVVEVMEHVIRAFLENGVAPAMEHVMEKSVNIAISRLDYVRSAILDIGTQIVIESVSWNTAQMTTVTGLLVHAVLVILTSGVITVTTLVKS